MTVLTTVVARADETGRAVAIVEPVSGSWVVDRIDVNSTSHVHEPECWVYRDYEHPANLIDATITGTNDTSELHPHISLAPGQQLVVVWFGCDPGSQSTAAIHASSCTPAVSNRKVIEKNGETCRPQDLSVASVERGYSHAVH